MDANSLTTVSAVIYDGSTNLSDFVRQFRLQALFHGWNDDKMLSSLPLFLKGRALRNYNDIVSKTNLEVVLKALADSCSQPKELLLYQFYERKRTQNESISKYALALQEMLAVPAMHMDQQTVLLRAQLCLGLPEHLRAMVQFNSAMSWDNLIVCLDKSLPHVTAYNAQQQQLHATQQPSRWDTQAQEACSLVKQEPLEE